MATTISGIERHFISSHSQQNNHFSYQNGNTAASNYSDRKDNGIPAGFPKLIVSPAAWTGRDFEGDMGREKYTSTFSAAEVRELEKACHDFEALGIPLENVSQDTFPLPTLGNKLKMLALELTSGVGFFRLCGLDPRRYSNKTNVVIYLGVSAYIGGKRGRQDELGNMLLHLTDLGAEVATETERQAPYSNVGQPFHTDVGDIIALYSLGEAECGGESQLAPTAAVFNEIVKTNPDMVRVLSSRSWIFDSFGLWPPYSVRPILYPVHDDKVLFAFSRRPLVGNASSPRSRDIPDLSASHLEAIDAIQIAAERHSLSMRLKPGDLLFWNNLTLLHSRSGFTDSPSRRRHLLRLWLRNNVTEKNWPIPEDLRASWNDAFDHAGRPQLWPIEPIIERDYIMNQQRSSGHD